MKRIYLLPAFIISVSPFFFPVPAFADMMRKGAMRHGYGGFYFFFYVVFKVAIVVALFWLLLRIARALEDIARSKS